MADSESDENQLESKLPSFDVNYVASLVKRHHEATTRREQQLLEMWILETVVWNNHPEKEAEGVTLSIQDWISLESRREALEKMDQPASPSGMASDEQEADEPPVFAEFSKDEVDRLYKTVSKTDDERAKRILHRAYVDAGRGR